MSDEACNVTTRKLDLNIDPAYDRTNRWPAFRWHRISILHGAKTRRALQPDPIHFEACRRNRDVANMATLTVRNAPARFPDRRIRRPFE